MTDIICSLWDLKAHSTVDISLCPFCCSFFLLRFFFLIYFADYTIKMPTESIHIALAWFTLIAVWNSIRSMNLAFQHDCIRWPNLFLHIRACSIHFPPLIPIFSFSLFFWILFILSRIYDLTADDNESWINVVKSTLLLAFFVYVRVFFVR